MSVFICKSLNDIPSVIQGTSIAFGVFDGVHAGHRFLIDKAKVFAKKNNGHSAVFTFDIDPDEFFKQYFVKLYSNSKRIDELNNLGVDDIIVLNFISIKELEPKIFLDKIFNDYLPTSIHVGEDFRFGAGASGDVNVLKEWGKKNGVKIFVYELLKEDGHVISSTWIRNHM